MSRQLCSDWRVLALVIQICRHTGRTAFKGEFLQPGRFKPFKILAQVVFLFLSLPILHFVAKLAKHWGAKKRYPTKDYLNELKPNKLDLSPRD